MCGRLKSKFGWWLCSRPGAGPIHPLGRPHGSDKCRSDLAPSRHGVLLGRSLHRHREHTECSPWLRSQTADRAQRPERAPGRAPEMGAQADRLLAPGRRTPVTQGPPVIRIGQGFMPSRPRGRGTRAAPRAPLVLALLHLSARQAANPPKPPPPPPPPGLLPRLRRCRLRQRPRPVSRRQQRGGRRRAAVRRDRPLWRRCPPAVARTLGLRRARPRR